jgi:hypothetical protein
MLKPWQKVETSPAVPTLEDRRRAALVLAGLPYEAPVKPTTTWGRTRSRIYRGRRMLAPLAGIAAVVVFVTGERLARYGDIVSPWAIFGLGTIIGASLYLRARRLDRHPGEAAIFAAIAILYMLVVACGA